MRSSFNKKRSNPRPAPPMSLEEAFNIFDKDGSGALSVDELQQVLTRPGGGAPLSREEVAEIISEFDTNNDGELQYEEFVALWNNSLGAMPSPKQSSTTQPSATRAVTKSGLQTIRPNLSSSSGKSERSSILGVGSSFRKLYPKPKQQANTASVLASAMSDSEKAAREAAARAAAAREKRKAAKPSPRSTPGPRLTPTSSPRATVAKESQKAPELPLLEAEALRKIATAETEAAEKAVQAGKEEGTFERRLGAALQANANAARATQGMSGAKQALNDLLREWDKNKDGNIQKMEFRQAVRGSLKLHARNEDIDKTFDRFDQDKVGQLTSPMLPSP